MGMIPATLPCGHPPYKEDDRYILDHCFECGWATQSRKEADKLNEIAAERGKAETELIRYARAGEYAGSEPIRLMDAVRSLHEKEEEQRQKVKLVRQEEDDRGTL